MNITNSSMMNIMTNALDAYTLRNEAIANNIANEDTPGYKRKDVNFESILNQTLDEAKLEANGDIGNIANRRKIANQNYANNSTSISQDGSINYINPEIYTQEEGSKYRIDKNNVDIDNEMSELVKNQMRYSVVMSQINNNFRAMRTAMNK